MSTNPYTNYYINQAGTGLTGYDGIRFQRGNGFFGSIFKNAILPVLKFLGKKIATTGVQVASDAIGGENVLESIKTRGKRTLQDIAEDAGERALRFAQTGQGKRRRRKASKKIAKKVIKKKRKRQARNTKSVSTLNKNLFL